MMFATNSTNLINSINSTNPVNSMNLMNSMNYIGIFSLLIFLSIASYLDFKKREVEDWLNYGFLFFAFFYNSLLSVVGWNYSYIVFSLIGFGIAYLISLLLFYTNQWGGGDAKAFIAFGAFVGLPINFDAFNIIKYHQLRFDLIFRFNSRTSNLFGNIFHLSTHFDYLPFIAQFIINLFIVGGIFAVCWAVYVAFRSKANRRKLRSSFIKLYKKYKLQKYAVWIFSAFLVVVGLFIDWSYYLKLLISSLGLLSFFMFYLLLFIKVVEKDFMIKSIDVSKVTEGDWIVKDVIVDGKHICGPKDNGISKEQIDELIKLKSKNKIHNVKIKEGMPFIPSFLIAFIFTLLFPNWFMVIH